MKITFREPFSILFSEHILPSPFSYRTVRITCVRTGVDVKGCDQCWQQCDLKFTPTKTSWWYTSVKNKSKMTAYKIAKSGRRVTEAKEPVTENEKNENEK